MKKLLYITVLGLLGFVGFTRANVDSVYVTPVTQSAISGSTATFTVTGHNATGDAYLKYVLPKTATYDVVYKSATLTPVNNLLLGFLVTEHDPIFFIPANSDFSVTITAKVTSTVRALPTLTSTAIFSDNDNITTTLTSAIAQITPISDLIVTNVLTGQNPSYSGDIISYYITLQNIGSLAANGINFISTFPIPSFYSPTATFNGTPHTYDDINYPADFVWSGNYLNLNPGQIITVLLNSSMAQNLAVGTTFNQTAKISTTNPEFTTGNNTSTAAGVVQALPDVRVTKTLSSFTGYRAGDEVRYTITYGNNGGKTANNVNIIDTMNGQVTLNATNFNIGSLPAGSGGTIIVTGSLNTTLTSGTMFINTANITTTSTEAVTGNNSSVATGKIQGIAAIFVHITANNLSRPQLDNTPYGSGPTTMIQAVSGDIIQFTMTYGNSGNTVATHAILYVSGRQNNFTATNGFNSTINIISIDEVQTIVLTGIVGPRNFISFTATPRITHDIGLTTMGNTVRIVEPLICGDGVLTRTEPCDTQGNLGVLFSGQTCENQQGTCVLATNAIVNLACINYQYTNPAGGVFTGQSCSSVNTALTMPSCTIMTGAVPTPTSNGYSINYNCRGNNTTATTPITIHCGNGTSISGTGGTLNGTCSYTGGFAGTAQCSVGSDVNNPLCRASVNETNVDCDLEPESRIVLVDDDGEGDVDFTCHTNNYQIVDSISIDCGAFGESLDSDQQRATSSANVSEFSTTCRYNVDIDDIPEDALAQCFINDNQTACEDEDIVIDQGTFGRCGDGEREGYEDCDDGNTTNGDGCDAGCDIENAAPVGCFSVAGMNISVQKDEYLPFRRAVDGDYRAADTCNETTHVANSIRRNSLMCNFSIKDSKNNIVKTINTPCKNTSTARIFNYFSTIAGTSYSNAYGKFTALLDDIDVYGEYKLSLDEVQYDYCEQNTDEERGRQQGYPLKRVCETNFTVTKPYLIQKSSFGLTPKATTNVDIKDFYQFGNEDNIITSTELDKIMLIDAEEYEGGSSIVTMMDTFITKYSRIAVKYTTVDSREGNEITVSKVPSQDIVVFKGEGTLVYTDGGKKTKPFTVIVDGPDLVINGSISNTNAMFLVNKGDITFQEEEANKCKATQIVKGIFVTKNNLVAGDNLKNDDINKDRCPYGGLKIQGILIGNGIENLVQSRRSQLNHWFMVGGSSEAARNTERRNEIFNGAAVLIEYSPGLWSSLPPGASEFTKALDVYKK